jgi:ABC-type sugar transport system ATPase subunit
MNLEMRGIWKAFDANVVLKDVQFSLKGGEICALLGENGAGKSTLMNILGGVLAADKGEILLDGKPVFLKILLNHSLPDRIHSSGIEPDQRPVDLREHVHWP